MTSMCTKSNVTELPSSKNQNVFVNNLFAKGISKTKLHITGRQTRNMWKPQKFIMLIIMLIIMPMFVTLMQST
jgi:hypothetical protein